jgi:hypothetical protein
MFGLFANLSKTFTGFGSALQPTTQAMETSPIKEKQQSDNSANITFKPDSNPKREENSQGI